MATNGSALLQSLKAVKYNPEVLKAMNDNLTGAELASTKMIDALKGIGTAGLDIGTGIQKVKTDQLKSALAEASRAGMQLDPETGQPVDPTGTGLTTILDQARERRDDATGFDMSGMVDFNALNQYQKELAGDRRTTAQEFRAVAGEKQLRSLDESKRTEARYKNLRLKQEMDIANFQENRNQLLAQLKLEEGALRLEFAGENNPQKIEEMQIKIKKLKMDAEGYAQKLIDKRSELLANIESTKEKTETERINQETKRLELKTKERLEDKAQEAEQHELVEDGQIETYNAFVATEGKVGGWEKLKQIMTQNYQEGIAQPRLVALANQYLAQNFDPTTMGLTKTELASIGKSRGVSAQNKLLNIVSKRLKAQYAGLIPDLASSKEFGATIKSQAQKIIDSNPIKEEFVQESLYAKESLPTQLKAAVDSQLAEGLYNLSKLEGLGKTPDEQLEALKTVKNGLLEMTDAKGRHITLLPGVEAQLRAARDDILRQRTDITLDSFVSKDGKTKLINLKDDLGYSVLEFKADQRANRTPKIDLAHFQSFEAKLKTIVDRDSRFFNTTPTVKQARVDELLRQIPGYTTGRTESTYKYGIQESIRVIIAEGSKKVEQERADFNTKVDIEKDPVETIFQLLKENKKENYKWFFDTDIAPLRADIVQTVNNIFNLYTPKELRHLAPGEGLEPAVKKELLYGIYRLYGVGEANGWGWGWLGNTEVTVPSISATEEKIGIFNWRWNVSLGQLSDKPENAAAMMNRFMPDVPLPKDRPINNSIFNKETSAHGDSAAKLKFTGDPRSTVASGNQDQAKNNAKKIILQN